MAGAIDLGQRDAKDLGKTGIGTPLDAIKITATNTAKVPNTSPPAASAA